MTEIQEPELLESYLFWWNAWEHNASGLVDIKEQFNGYFPSSYYQWLAVIEQCPLHSGPTIMVNKQGRNIFCLCKVLEICHFKKEEIRDIVQPPPKAYLSDIHPQQVGNNPTEAGDTLAFLDYLGKEWLSKPEQFIVDGGVGSGKTTILKALYWEHPQVSLYMPIREMASFIYDFDRLKEHISALQHYPILLLDDVGSEHKTDYVMDLMYQIVDYRYAHRDQIVTVISTNELRVMKDSKDMQVQRLVSRYLDGKRFVLTQGDYRKRKVLA